jgi:Domain of unknown function (DUF3597)
MSIFGNIMSKIFGGGAQAASAGASAPSTAQAGGGSTATTSKASSQTPGSSSGQTVDVEAVLKEMASKSGQKLDYRRSIVDLMKLLDLDSSLTARKELAKELNYTGDTNDSATMNVWLHKQVMRKLAENGGKVPDDLKD